MRNADHFTPWIDNLTYNWLPLKNYSETKSFKKGELVFQEGNPIREVLIILRGRIRLFTNTIHGKEKTLIIVGKNCLLGEHFFSGYNKQILNAEVVSDVLYKSIPIDIFENLVAKDPFLSKEVLSLLSLKMMTMARSSTLDISYGTSLQKIIKTLIYLNKAYGEVENEQFSKISIPFTQQELADLIGVSRVTVAKSFSYLNKQDLLYKSNSYYYLNLNIIELL